MDYFYRLFLSPLVCTALLILLEYIYRHINIRWYLPIVFIAIIVYRTKDIAGIYLFNIYGIFFPVVFVAMAAYRTNVFAYQPIINNARATTVMWTSLMILDMTRHGQGVLGCNSSTQTLLLHTSWTSWASWASNGTWTGEKHDPLRYCREIYNLIENV